jgi:hypothetical protein
MSAGAALSPPPAPYARCSGMDLWLPQEAEKNHGEKEERRANNSGGVEDHSVGQSRALCTISYGVSATGQKGQILNIAWLCTT